MIRREARKEVTRAVEYRSFLQGKKVGREDGGFSPRLSKLPIAERCRHAPVPYPAACPVPW